MKHLKLLMVMAIAFLSFSSVQAQTSKKKASTKKTATAKAYQCPMKCEGDKTYAKAGKCPVCKMNLKEVKKMDKNAVAYQCPMKCEGDKTYAKEGKCPVCNMNLKSTAKKEESHSDHKH